MNAHDTSKLQDLGRRRQRLEAQLAEIDAALDVEIPAAAAAGVPQVSIMGWTGLARESVRRKSMDEAGREALREARRAKNAAK